VQSSYYQQYYSIEREHWWFKARAEIIMQKAASVLGGVEKPRILNIGAATGYSSQLLNKLGEVISVEYDKDCFEFTRTLPGIELVNASITDLPFENESFDLVCAFDVIEHVSDDSGAWREMRRVCKSKGIIFVTVPAFQFLWSEHDIINHHERRYSKKQLLNVAGNKDILYCSYFNFLLFLPIALFRLIKNIVYGKPLASDAKSDFGNNHRSFSSRLLYQIFCLEKPLIKSGLSLPFGVSCMLIQKVIK
jgi:SAM-dependent methyltransferase